MPHYKQLPRKLHYKLLKTATDAYRSSNQATVLLAMRDALETLWRTLPEVDQTVVYQASLNVEKLNPIWVDVDKKTYKKMVRRNTRNEDEGKSIEYLIRKLYCQSIQPLPLETIEAYEDNLPTFQEDEEYESSRYTNDDGEEVANGRDRWGNYIANYSKGYTTYGGMGGTMSYDHETGEEC